MLQVRSYWGWSMLALIVALAGGLVTWQPAQAAPRDRQAGGDQSLKSCMEQMGKAYKSLAKQIDDATRNTESIKLTCELQKLAIMAKNQMPDSVAKLEGDARKQALVEFRRDMGKLVRELLDLEAALLADDNAQAGKIVKQISATMKDGHAEFAKD